MRRSEGMPATPAHAFRWRAADEMEDLGAFMPGFPSDSSATTHQRCGLDNGLFGHRRLRPARSRVDAGELIDIDTFNSRDSLPVAVAAKGPVAGAFIIPGSGFLNHAFLWTGASGMLDLGTAGGTESFVLAMSPAAHVAGVINFASGAQHATSWIRSSGMVDSGTLGGI